MILQQTQVSIRKNLKLLIHNYYFNFVFKIRFTTCVNDSKLSLDEVELTQVTRIERNDQFVMTLNDLSKVDDITTDEDKSISILTSTGINNNHETNFTYFNDEYTNYEESLISFNSTSLVEINDEFMVKFSYWIKLIAN